MRARAIGVLLVSTVCGCVEATQTCPARTGTQGELAAREGTKRPAVVRWWILIDGPSDEIRSQEIGRDEGTVALLADSTEANCTYDRVIVEAGREGRWVRCQGNGWRVQTIAACSGTYYAPSGATDPNLDDMSMNADDVVMLAAGTDGKQFGVGIRCQTIPKREPP